MNEQLQNALVDLLTKVTSGIDNATAFLAWELPDVVQQLLRWKLVEHSLKSIFCLVVIACVIWFATAFIRGVRRGAGGEGNFFHDGTSYRPVTTHAVFTAMAAGVAALFATAGLASHSLYAVQIWLAPKIFLIEYVAYLTTAKG